jgi:maltodextrin utilization protein YvdJ
MVCPNCGVDVERFKQEITSRRGVTDRKTVDREEEFQKLYGPILQSIIKKRAWVGGILGFTVGALLTLIIFRLSFLFSNEVFSEKLSEEIAGISWPLLAVTLLFFLIPAIILAVFCYNVAKLVPGRQEKILRKIFFEL